MRVLCSYCGAAMGEREPLASEDVSHGICKECTEEFPQRWGGAELGRYLDLFEMPVIAVNRDSLVIAANQHMASMLGEPQRSVFGLLGGQVMECEYSKLPGGCGHTTHCPACTIRRTVMATMEDGQNRDNVSAVLQREDGAVVMSISTVLERTITGEHYVRVSLHGSEPG